MRLQSFALLLKIILKPSLPVFTFLIITLFSCSPYKFSTVQIDAATLNKRLDSGAKNFVLQFYGDNADIAKSPLKLISYAYLQSSESSVTKVERDLLSAFKDHKATKFKGTFFLGNNTVSRKQIDTLLNDSATNKRMDYSYVIFRPVKDSSTNYIRYMLQVVTNSTSTRKDPVLTEPCPPAVCNEDASFE